MALGRGRMSAFEFLISFYGLLLGLSIAEIAGGFSRTWDRRDVHQIGWLAPLLALILLADLTSFWTNVWSFRDSIDVSYFVAFSAAIITLLYYFAATQVFPRDRSTVSPDAHVMAHRQTVVSAVMLSNVLAIVGSLMLVGFSPGVFANTLLMNLPLFVFLAAIGWLPGHRSVLAAMLVTLPVTIFYEPIMVGIVDLFR